MLSLTLINLLKKSRQKSFNLLFLVNPMQIRHTVSIHDFHNFWHWQHGCMSLHEFCWLHSSFYTIFFSFLEEGKPMKALY